MNTFKERFAELVRDLNKNDTEVARDLSVSKQTVSAWKAGTRSPRKPLIVNIASKYKVSIEWLMGYDVPKQPDKPQPQPEPQPEKQQSWEEMIGNLDYTAHGIAARVVPTKKPQPTAAPSTIDEMINQLQEMKAQQAREKAKIQLTGDEEQLIDDYRALSPDRKKKAHKIIAILADETEGLY